MGRKSKNQKWREAISEKLTKLTPEVVSKLKEAFAIGASVAEACFYSEISERTYYRWTEKNEELCQEFERMRQKLPLAAKRNIALAIQAGDLLLSKWLVEHTQPKDYAETQKLEHSGEVITTEGFPEDEELKREFRERYMQNVVKRLQNKKQLTEKNGE
jgi:hypothetical protein